MTDKSLGSMVWEEEGEGDVVLMVHGLGGSTNSFQTLMPALSGFRILRVDLPGAGRSRFTPGNISMSSLVSAVTNCLTASSVSSAHVIGHSMGSLIAQYLAVQLPGRIASLTLFGAIDEPSETARMALKQRAAQARRDGMTDIAHAVSQNSVSRNEEQDNTVAQAFVRESLMRQNPNGYAAHCEALSEATRAAHESIVCPTLIIAGSDDPVSPPKMAEELRDAIPDSRLTMLNRIGHWMMVEAASESRKLVRQHLISRRH